ncbi:MAG: hypothetical protein ACE5HE_02810 [Phycisphaerae bacterium]
MALTFDPRHLFLVGRYHRLWLVLATLLAFMLAALWPQPVG